MSELTPTTGRPRVLSGMQPSSDSLHLGNYLGALKQWVALQDGHESLYCVVDLHGITVKHDPEQLRTRSRRTAAQFLAGGVDSEKSILFIQSHVPQHCELAWVLSCITGFGEASRMTQFKDKSAKQGADSASVGLFTYPILMAADILLYQPSLVPIGDDQKQHLELTRDLAARFNSRFGETFTMPEPFIPQTAARVMDLQNPTSKMSKSAESPNGLLEVLEQPKVVAKRIKSAVTDAGTEISYDETNKPGVSNLLSIHSAISGESIDDLVASYEGKMYGHLKVDVAGLVEDLFKPIRDKVTEYLGDEAELDRILDDGARRAQEIAQDTLDKVYDAVGFLPRRTL